MGSGKSRIPPLKSTDYIIKTGHSEERPVFRHIEYLLEAVHKATAEHNIVVIRTKGTIDIQTELSRIILPF